MKKLLMLLVLAPLMALADTWKDPNTGIWWTYTVSGGQAQVGTGEWGSPAILSSTTGAISIPSKLGGYSVTSIGDYAFYGCSGLTSVTIPSSVTSIGDDAFWGCGGLAEFIVEEGNSSYCVRDGILYNKSMTELIQCPAMKSGSVTIPDSVTSIGDDAFAYCSGLKSVTIPSSVTSIGVWTFARCSGLTSILVEEGNSAYRSKDGILYNKTMTALIQCPGGKTGSVTIPSSVTSIGWSAFEGCSGLTSVTIPSSVRSIGGYAFYGCSGLTSVTIPSGVTSIGMYAFYHCSGLTTVMIPPSVTSIGDSAFFGCSGLTEFVVDDGNTAYCLNDGILYDKAMTELIQCPAKKTGSVTIPSSVTSIGDRAFFGCSGLTSVTIPSSVTSIGDRAFSGCSGLTSVTIPSGVTSIEDFAFSSCDRLTSVTIPSSVTSIGECAFAWCSGLKSVTIPEGVTSIGEYAFAWCSGLKSVTIPSGVTSIEESAFAWCSGLTSMTIPSSVTSIGDDAFWGCGGLTEFIVEDGNSSYCVRDGILYNKSMTELIQCPAMKSGSVTIPSSVTSIGDRAFEDCSGLKSVTIPSSVTSIGYEAFYGCSGLTSVTIPSGVTSIGVAAFYGCSGLKSVTIPSGVTSIGDDAFWGCGGLKSVTIPSSVTSIGAYAFRGCSELKTVYVSTKNEIDRVKEMIGRSGFDASHLTFVVRDGAGGEGEQSKLSPGAIAGIAVGSAVVAGVGGYFIGRAVSEAIGKKGGITRKEFKKMVLVVPELDRNPNVIYKNRLVYHPARGTVTGRIVLTVQKGDRTQTIRAKAKGTLKNGVITGTLDAKGLGTLDFTVK